MKIFQDDGFTDICGDKVGYGFFGRTGGVSQGIYESLNCGPGSGDDQAHIAENRRRVGKAMGAVDGTVSSIWQCHSADCLYIENHVETGDARPKGDALVTDKKGLAIGILTADCGPVLFSGHKPDGAPVIGAAHAGWGGALGGILEATIATMNKAGAATDGIAACIGPCIGVACYEVSEDFMRPFVIKHEHAEKFFMSARRDGHLMFDLAGYICFRLALAGVKIVRVIGVDTYKDNINCFSYRRATHRGEESYGRQMSAIMIK